MIGSYRRAKIRFSNVINRIMDISQISIATFMDIQNRIKWTHKNIELQTDKVQNRFLVQNIIFGSIIRTGYP